MNRKLEIQHLAPYLPYGLKMGVFDYYEDGDDEWEIQELGSLSVEKKDETLNEWWNADGDNHYMSSEFKPILRSLSDLTKEIEVNGERFTPSEWFEIGDDDNNSEEYDNGNVKLCKEIEWASLDSGGHDARMLPFGVVQKLFEWHFDVFGLIEKNLAIDINTIAQ